MQGTHARPADTQISPLQRGCDNKLGEDHCDLSFRMPVVVPGNRFVFAHTPHVISTYNVSLMAIELLSGTNLAIPAFG